MIDCYVSWSFFTQLQDYLVGFIVQRYQYFVVVKLSLVMSRTATVEEQRNIPSCHAVSHSPKNMYCLLSPLQSYV